jgi:hypothetical protein
VIQTFHCNTKAALTKKSYYFISIRNVVFQSYSIVTFAVVKSKIGVVISLVRTWLLLIHHWLYLLDVLAEVVHLRVVKYFCAFILCQMVQFKFKHFCRRQGIRNVVNSLLLINGSLLWLAVLYFPFVKLLHEYRSLGLRNLLEAVALGLLLRLGRSDKFYLCEFNLLRCSSRCCCLRN